MLALPTFCLSLRELLPIQLKWKEVFWGPAAIRLEPGFGISRASPSQTCPCFLQKAVTIPFQKSLHIQLPSLADKTWASARRGFGGSIRLYWCEVGTATASSCRKPSHIFPCCGRKRRKIKGPKCSWKGVGGVSHKRLFLTNHLYITALWWPLCFLVLNWGRRRNSALQVSFSAEEKFPTTSRRTATELWARPSTHIWTCTRVHTYRAMHRVTYIQTAPDTSSCLWAVLRTSLYHPSANLPSAELQRLIVILCAWPLFVWILWPPYSSVCACTWYMSLCIQEE